MENYNKTEQDIATEKALKWLFALVPVAFLIMGALLVAPMFIFYVGVLAVVVAVTGKFLIAQAKK